MQAAKQAAFYFTMEILLPDNIFARILYSAFSEKNVANVHFFPASLLSKKLAETKKSVALIPTLDLLNHKDFFVSKSLGISYDESLSNSYIYFIPQQELANQVVLAGDVSSSEGILTKILFSEAYGIDVQLSLEKTNDSSSGKNRILVGDRNFIEDKIESGISFTEEIIELISAPYVSFVFASQTEEVLKEFNSFYHSIISAINSTKIFEGLGEKFSVSTKNYLMENLQHVAFDFNEQDLEGIKRLLELPYYHGIIKDMIDVKFV